MHIEKSKDGTFKIDDKSYQEVGKKHYMKFRVLLVEFFNFRAPLNPDCEHCTRKIEAKRKQVDRKWRKYCKKNTFKGSLPPLPEAFEINVKAVLEQEIKDLAERKKKGIELPIVERKHEH